MRTLGAAWILGAALVWASTAAAQDELPTTQQMGGPEPAPEPAQPEPVQPEPQAPPPSEAERHFEQGRVLYEAGNYEAAVPELERAAELLAGAPERFDVIYALGQTYEQLFRYDAALSIYERYQAEAPADAPDRADVAARIRVLEGLLALVSIRTNVPRAEVWLDGHHVGDAPGDVRVPGGRHDLELRAPGRLPARREISVAARETLEVRLDLEAPSSGISPIFFWSAAGASVAVLATGFIFGALTLGAGGDGDDLAGAPGGTTATEDDAEHVRQLALTADIFYAGAALLATGATILYFVTDWGDDTRVEATAGGLRFAGSF